MKKRKNNIYLILKGGLGNQLFQLNFALWLSKKLSMEYYIDLSSYKTDSYKRKPIIKKLINKKKIINLSKAKIFIIKIFSFIQNKISLIKILPKIFSFYIYNDFNYNSSEFRVRDYFLLGYFQSFNFIDKELKDKLNSYLINYIYENKLTNKIENLSIRSSEIAVVHIRGKDYLKQLSNKEIYLKCNYKYYMNAIKYLENENKIKKLIIITDDKKYAKEIASKLDKNFEISNGDEFLDLFILSKAKNLIIANSTFSLWGAYINNILDSKIICPMHWYYDEKFIKPHIPKNWKLINNV